MVKSVSGDKNYSAKSVLMFDYKAGEYVGETTCIKTLADYYKINAGIISAICMKDKINKSTQSKLDNKWYTFRYKTDLPEDFKGNIFDYESNK